MEKIDRLIKNYLEGRAADVSGQRTDASYPSAEVLYAYLADELEGRELERMLAFLRNNPDGQELVTRARELMESEAGWESEKVPAEWTERAQTLMRPKGPGVSCPHCGKPITPFKKGLPPGHWRNWLWLVLAAVSFGFSFAIPRYFYQCLAVSLFFGFKWIVERRAAKTQIMIYKALSEDAEPERQRLHRHSSRL